MHNVITGTDLGIWRRIRLIPFTYCIPDHEKDSNFKTRLLAPDALAGILNWAIEGALLWQKEGLKPPEAVLNATQAYREEMDVLAAWISDCCVVHKLADAKASDLYASYSAWCESQGERPETQRSFGLRLTERGFTRNRTTGGAHRWFGIGLLAPDHGYRKSDPSDPSDPEFDIKGTNFGGGFCNVRNRVTSVTSVTPNPPTDVVSPQHSPPVDDDVEYF